VLDDGRLTDGHGRTVDFTNTLVVMTSNVGSQAIQQITQEGGSEEDIQAAVQTALKSKFLPEFLNRIDETIVFEPLGWEQVRRIVDLQLQHLEAKLAENHIRLIVSDAAAKQIASEGFDPQYGARPLKRVIQRRLQNPLATELLRRNVPEGTAIKVDYVDDGFIFETSAEQEANLVGAR
jgi:ATP-dependent Clp protease ATP-binding subunit ClpB